MTDPLNGLDARLTVPPDPKRRPLPGSGPDCACDEHRANCRFGYQHGWSTYVPEALWSNFGVDLDLAKRGKLWCYVCHSVHVLQDGEEW